MDSSNDRAISMIDHEERLRQLGIIGDQIGRGGGGTGGEYNGQFLQVGDSLYEVLSREARTCVKNWLREGVIRRGHINRYASNGDGLIEI
ncbi:MAG: hypothetical protein ABIH92_00940 [Nanoarchaeota archaeon]